MNIVTNTYLIIPNVFNESERELLNQCLTNYNWYLNNFSASPEENIPRFWAGRPRDIHATKGCKEFFKLKIEAATKLKVEVLKIHINGQTHGQSGNWHIDAKPDAPEGEETYTLVYFPKVWQPEYGGHLLLRLNGEVHSILPEFNKGVIFRTTTEHVGLEPTVHCKHMRESIACSFKVLV
jgi:Rps23 Pro-64 3,4-dihydroxylase Tpa1-like proline 4-hydroxylase